jgi:hypothetical protein
MLAYAALYWPRGIGSTGSKPGTSCSKKCEGGSGKQGISCWTVESGAIVGKGDIEREEDLHVGSTPCIRSDGSIDHQNQHGKSVHSSEPYSGPDNAPAQLVHVHLASALISLQLDAWTFSQIQPL